MTSESPANVIVNTEETVNSSGPTSKDSGNSWGDAPCIGVAANNKPAESAEHVETAKCPLDMALDDFTSLKRALNTKILECNDNDMPEFAHYINMFRPRRNAENRRNRAPRRYNNKYGAPRQHEYRQNNRNYRRYNNNDNSNRQQRRGRFWCKTDRTYRDEYCDDTTANGCDDSNSIHRSQYWHQGDQGKPDCVYCTRNAECGKKDDRYQHSGTSQIDN